MTVRALRADDEPLIRALWDRFVEELDDPYPNREAFEEAWPGLRRQIESGAAAVAEEDDETLGFVFATLGERGRPFAHVTNVYVVPEARRRGIGKQLLAYVVQRAAERALAHVSLDVSLQNAQARAVYERLGFAPVSQWLVTDRDALERRLNAGERRGASGTIYVQTDDRPRVEHAVAQFVPRLGRSEHTDVSDPGDGWIAIDDELCSREPELLRRLARELSDRLGAVVVSLGIEEDVVRFILFERGRVMDEYLSVPEYFGPLPPGDVIALAANPTVVARLTGADPARVRAVARTASSASELPPAEELAEQIRDALRLPHG